MKGARAGSCDLTGKVGLITGGGGLLGGQHARALAGSGARVILADVNLDAARQTASLLDAEYGRGTVQGMRMDVTDPRSIRKCLEEGIRRHGRMDILVNNAAIDAKVKGGGGGREFTRLENFPLERWDLEVSIGLTGAFLCSQVLGTWMAAHEGGVILNIASDLSVIAPDQRLYRRPGLPEDRQPVKPVTYSVIKTGLIGLTRYLAAYWAGKKVRVNALSPGGVFAGQDRGFVRRLTRLIPMGRMADVDEYQAAVQFLCSDASRYMTGQNVVMDGGRSIL